MVRNLPRDRNKETGRSDETHSMRQKVQFQQVKDSVRGMRSSRVSHIITPNPYEGFPYV